MKQVFAVIGKRPVEGYSKTRLAEDVGPENAYELYDSFMEDFFSNFRKHTKNAFLYFHGAPAIKHTEEYFKQLFLKHRIENYEFSFQKEKPFFERLTDILDEVRFKEDGETFVHLTGTDIPDFPFSHLKEQDIDEADVFIGPDEDGGFYYIGTKAKNDEIFSFIKTKKEDETVFVSLNNKCVDLGLKVKVLNPWSDIDTKEDLEKSISRSHLDIIPETVSTFNKLIVGKDT